MWLHGELLLKWLVVAGMTVTAGAAAMMAHGVLLHWRLRSGQSLSDCVTPRARLLALVSTILTALLLTHAQEVPWDWLGRLALLVTIAPVVLTWLGPPDEHVEACSLCQIGKGSAYSHYFGYLRLMQGKNGIRERLEQFKLKNSAGLQREVTENFYSEAVVVLAPRDGEYPSNFAELKGVGQLQATVDQFKQAVGGNKRSYGHFGVHRVTSSDGNSSKCVALDKVGALATLRKLRQHGPANLSDIDCKNQMKEMMTELETVVESSSFLRGQLKVVSYDAGEHVGDAILTAIAD